MSTSNPPRFATWLLRRFVPGQQWESLIGDLMEQHRRKRSGAWYWRQVLAAILVGAVRDIREHKLLTMRAVTVCYCLMRISSFLAEKLYRFFGLWVWNWTVAHDFDTIRL